MFAVPVLLLLINLYKVELAKYAGVPAWVVLSILLLVVATLLGVGRGRWRAFLGVRHFGAHPPPWVGSLLGCSLLLVILGSVDSIQIGAALPQDARGLLATVGWYGMGLPPKSGHERVVPLAPELRAAVAEAMRSKFPSARLILNSNGHTPTRQTVLSTLYALQNRIGLARRSFHLLRHFFCTTLIRNGASPEAVRVLAGHHDLTVTQRYVHATAADLDAAIARAQGQLAGNGTEVFFATAGFF